ncbi:hypothetical protein [Chroococcidiopsis sp.]
MPQATANLLGEDCGNNLGRCWEKSVLLRWRSHQHLIFMVTPKNYPPGI